MKIAAGDLDEAETFRHTMDSAITSFTSLMTGSGQTTIFKSNAVRVSFTLSQSAWVGSLSASLSLLLSLAATAVLM